MPSRVPLSILRTSALLAVCLLAGLPATAQQEPTAAVHVLLQPLVERPSPEIPPVLRGEIGGFQGRRQLDGQEMLSLHLRTTAERQELEAAGVRVRSMRGGRAVVDVAPRDLAELARRGDVQSIALPRVMRPNLDASLPDTGIDVLRSESGGVFSGATGAGVIVGVVDSGIDVDHPDFTDASGNTRILYLWDQQNDDASRFPSLFSYGTEWTGADIDAGISTATDESSAWGHGTHVTAIAAGSGAAPDGGGATYTAPGVAPEASIVFVKTSWATDDIVDALEYIFDKADSLNMPCVVNLSLGSQVGAHDGTDSLEEAIDDLVTAEPGRAVVVAAGNEHGDEIHAELEVTPRTSALGPDFEIDAYTATGGAGNDYLLMVGYYDAAADLEVHLTSPGGDSWSMPLNTSPFGSRCLAPSSTADGYVYLCNDYRSQFDQGTSDREIVVYVFDNSASRPPGSGTWSMAVTDSSGSGSSGDVDFWMTSNLGGSASNARFTLRVDESETLGVPATSREAITVGAHVTKTCWSDYTGTSQAYASSYFLGDIAPFSGRGPSRDGRLEPDLTAPGMGVVSGLAQEVRSDLIAAGAGAYVVDDHHLLLQGTSQAAPHVTGAVALLFEEDPTRTTSDVESLLEGFARDNDLSDSYATTTGIVYPPLVVNYTFGAGRLDLGAWGQNDPYETNEEPRDAYRVVSGRELEGYLEHAGDVDYFRVEGMEPGDTLSADLTGLPEDYALALQYEWLYSVVCGTQVVLGTDVASDNAGTADESATSTGWVSDYVRVTSSSGAFDTSTPYQLTAILTRPESSSSHSTVATAQELPEFERMRVTGGVASLGARDVYEVVVDAGDTLDATLGFLAPFGLRVEILDGSGTVLSSASGSGTASVTAPSFPFFLPTTYYVQVRRTTLFGGGSYTLTLTDR